MPQPQRSFVWRPSYSAVTPVLCSNVYTHDIEVVAWQVVRTDATTHEPIQALADFPISQDHNDKFTVRYTNGLVSKMLGKELDEQQKVLVLSLAIHKFKRNGSV